MLRIFAFILGFIATAAFAQTYPPQITAIDPATKITITDLASANTKRADLVGSIFGPSGMNATLVPSYYSTFNPAGTTWAGALNVASIQEWRVTVSKGFVSRLYKFTPTTYRNPTSGKAGFIIAAGHGHIGTTDPYTQLIKWLVASGYEVWTVDMPISGLNAPPNVAAWPTVLDPVLGNIQFNRHDEFELLQTASFNPIRIFMEPPLAIVNDMYARGVTNVGMSGLSGGGWTTDVYSALDPRIKASYSIAGSMPVYTRSWTPPHDSSGDWEQMELPAMGFDYLDLYVLASVPAGRTHYNLHNVNDDCCFGGYTAMHYEQAVKNVVTAIGGYYDVVFDTTATTHTISAWTANAIEQDVITHF
jgi:dienelactone hydrolase